MKYWNRVRRLVLKRDLFCCHCLVEYSTDVDHKIPVALGGADYLLENLQGLCYKCHRIKTRKDMITIHMCRGKRRCKVGSKEYIETLAYYNHLFKGGNGDISLLLKPDNTPLW